MASEVSGSLSACSSQLCRRCGPISGRLELWNRRHRGTHFNLPGTPRLSPEGPFQTQAPEAAGADMHVRKVLQHSQKPSQSPLPTNMYTCVFHKYIRLQGSNLRVRQFLRDDLTGMGHTEVHTLARQRVRSQSHARAKTLARLR